MKKIVVCFLLIVSVFVSHVFTQNTFVSTGSSYEQQTSSDSTSDKKTSQEATDLKKLAQQAMSNKDYMVTAGDIYSLSFLAGSTPVVYSISVDSTYKIRVANLAVIDATNTTFINLKKQVEDIVTRNYPFSGVQFLLITPSSFTVRVTGEVEATTEVPVWALSRLSSVVDAVKNDFASIRNIKITAANGTEKNYDLFKAQRDGDMSQDPYLRPGDVITLNHLERQVKISGAVERPGVYELIGEENLKDLVETYGKGLAVMADPERIQLTRISNSKEKTGEKQFLTVANIQENYPLEHYDEVYVPSYNDLRPVVFLQGAVNSSDNLSANLETTNLRTEMFSYGESYSNFIRRNREVFSANADLANAYVTRGQNFIAIDLSQILYSENFTNDLLLEPNDVLVVPFKQYFVTVAGAVNSPGRYPYIPNRDWEYYVGLAGGFIGEKNNFDAVKIKDVNGKTLKKEDLITPETTITAKTNSFTYYFNQYAPVITTTLSLILTSITLYTTLAN